MNRGNRLLVALRSYPDGVTAKEMSRGLGTDHRNVSSQLSKLAAYGVIEKVRGGEDRAAVYVLPASASTATRQ